MGKQTGITKKLGPLIHRQTHRMFIDHKYFFFYRRPQVKVKLRVPSVLREPWPGTIPSQIACLIYITFDQRERFLGGILPNRTSKCFLLTVVRAPVSYRITPWNTWITLYNDIKSCQGQASTTVCTNQEPEPIYPRSSSTLNAGATDLGISLPRSSDRPWPGGQRCTHDASPITTNRAPETGQELQFPWPDDMSRYFPQRP